MIARLHEQMKLDIALLPMALNNTNATGRYFDMKAHKRALFVLMGGAMAATKTTKIEVFEAQDAAGAGPAQALTGATCTITANGLVTKATVALDTVLNGETITINGLTFTAHTDTTTAADREFKIDGDNTADAEALAGLINDPVYGVPGVVASAVTGTITLVAHESGETTITIETEDSTFTVATVEAIAFVEVEAYDLSEGFTHVAAKVTTTANSVVAVALLRAPARELPVTQRVGASKTL